MEINGQQCCTGIFRNGEQLERIWLLHVMGRFQSLLLEDSEGMSGTNFISPKAFSESFSPLKSIAVFSLILQSTDTYSRPNPHSAIVFLYCSLPSSV